MPVTHWTLGPKAKDVLHDKKVHLFALRDACNLNSPAVGYFLFSPVAVDVVHPDPLETVSELRAVGRPDDTREAELLADDLGLDGIPLVVADRAPLTLVVDLHVSLLKQNQIADILI